MGEKIQWYYSSYVVSGFVTDHLSCWSTVLSLEVLSFFSFLPFFGYSSFDWMLFFCLDVLSLIGYSFFFLNGFWAWTSFLSSDIPFFDWIFSLRSNILPSVEYSFSVWMKIHMLLFIPITNLFLSNLDINNDGYTKVIVKLFQQE